MAYEIVNKAFPENYVYTKSESIFEWYNYSERHAVFISISDKFFLGGKDLNALMDFVRSGNTAFISANYIDSALLQEVGVAQHNMGFMEFLYGMRMEDTYLKSGPVDADKSKYSYFYKPMLNYFDTVVSEKSLAISGTNDNDKPNVLVLNLDAGKLILHCEPNGLSNYFLLTKNNKDNFTNLLHLMHNRPEDVYWDDYYPNKLFPDDKDDDSSLLDTLKLFPELYKAFLLALLMLFIFLLFGHKRTQRIIPTIESVQNSSVQFAEAIAGLYMRDKDHKIIAYKMIVYFFEKIRNRYYINTNNINDEFSKTLSRKSGYPEDKTKALINEILSISASVKISGKQLQELNRQIENFNKHIV